MPPDVHDHWPDPTLTDLDLVQQVLDALPEPRSPTYEVSTAVESPPNNSPDLLTPAT